MLLRQGHAERQRQILTSLNHEQLDEPTVTTGRGACRGPRAKGISGDVRDEGDEDPSDNEMRRLIDDGCSFPKLLGYMRRKYYIGKWVAPTIFLAAGDHLPAYIVLEPVGSARLTFDDDLYYELYVI